ncbi:Modification methylase PaeR7I Short=M.PaeR7I [Fibrisoma limi BUZ 3]|uniref:site-specific DNA-methyltransferase (adenine-specific) n=1 Tax=Fibrisoma limi BUZ 3 TaxID=1185876 RepID=I2GD74_9BACT|nr:Eco57I restriction-modification methylase domain-containing protein [Fibrisoma limi]CCH51848.1 Modification methylase PaeR7I Short=M.PaeR7I [Fibrisoma limi BUZ 3]
MRLQLRKPTQSLNKAYAKQSITQERMDTFRRALGRLFSRLDEDETEEHQKNIVAGFLNEAFYADRFEINTRERIDLVIHRGPTSHDEPAVIIEAKRVFAGEMITPIKNNVKALHELILYYFEERERHQNIAISQLVITDVYNWFFFDENDFRHFFYDNAKLRKLYQIKQQQKKDNTFFYAETARILRELDDELPVTYLNLREAADLLDADPARLIPVYKLFSPEHLLKLPFANDANQLNRSFYNELLHIIGLHETVQGGRKLIQRLPEGERQEGSLLENTINILRVDNVLSELDAPDQYGQTEEEQLFGVGLGLCITWLNRILFLKLLEGQLVRYHHNDRSVQFLTSRHLREFDELHELFFEVLAVPEGQRPASIQTRFGPIPYLNSSLFELTDLERKAKIKDLKDRLELPLYEQTVLRNQHGKRQTGQLPTLNYLLAFLDAYDFSSEGPAEIQSENKPLINAAVLGLIFEKLNGYRDGSFFTPGFVTMYMVRDAIRRAVVGRFNEQFGWTARDLTDVYNQLDRIPIAEANAVINGLRICDPAVGSGHFLVSALNELIAIKAELGILADRDGRRLRGYDIAIVNDELVITDEDGLPFQYFAPGGVGRGAGGQGRGAGGVGHGGGTIHALSERQRVQETLFHEKQTLIENCLFGVDINPNSVNICRLRLWIELLKSAYYVAGGMGRRAGGVGHEVDAIHAPLPMPHAPGPTPSAFTLQTLPNLDINLKAGNSLIGRFELDRSFSEIFEHPRFNLRAYRAAVLTYKQARSKDVKQDVSRFLNDINAYLRGIYLNRDPLLKDISRLRGELALLDSSLDLFATSLPPARGKKGEPTKEQKRQKLQTELAVKEQALEDKRRNPLFRNAFEWRFEFPEVLDETGNFVGFDVVVGNPPYIRQEELGANKTVYQKAFPNTYAGTADLYVMFIEQGLNLLRVGGQFAYILPNKWMRAGYGANLRKWLKQWNIEQITDFGDLPVFDEATTYPSILAIQKAPSTGQLRAAQVDTLKFGKGGLAAYLPDRTFSVPTDSLQDGGWVLSDASVQNLLTKLRKTGKPLCEYVQDKIYYGVKTGLNEAFVINAETRDRLIAEDPRSAEVIKPFLAGRDIKRYQTPKAEKFLIFARRGIQIEDYPAILKHLETYREELMPKPKGFSGKWNGRKAGTYNWYEIQDAVDYFPEFEKPHIIAPTTTKESSCIWDESGIYFNEKTTIVATANKYVLGIMNCRTTNFVMQQISSTKQNGYFEYKPVYISQIPIPDISADAQAPFIEKVDAILAAKRDNPKADTSALEAELDQMVYALFALTPEEIVIVEGA